MPSTLLGLRAGCAYAYVMLRLRDGCLLVVSNIHGVVSRGLTPRRVEVSVSGLAECVLCDAQVAFFPAGDGSS